MDGSSVKGGRAASAGVLLIGGGAVAVASWIGGSHGWAIGAMAVYAVLALMAYAWAGRHGDVAAILRVGGDEQQRGLDRDATAVSGIVVVVVAIVGALIEIGRTGNPGAYGVLCVVAGASYAVSLAAFRWRR
jgi:hypothetical protein